MIVERHSKLGEIAEVRPLPTEPQRYIHFAVPTGAILHPAGKGCRMVRVSQEDPWAKIPHWVVTSPELDASAIRVYAVLSKHANYHTRDAHPGMRRIADEACCSLSTVQRSLDALEVAGAIVVDRCKKGGRNLVNQYHLPLTRVPMVGTPHVPMVGTRVPAGVTPDVPITGTELEGRFKEQEDPDFEFDSELEPRLPGESRATWLHRINHQGT